MAALRLVSATLDATVWEVVGGPNDGERHTTQLPSDVLLPPHPTIEQYAEAMAEWTTRRDAQT